MVDIEYSQLILYFQIFVMISIVVALLGTNSKDRNFGISKVLPIFSVLLCCLAVVVIVSLPVEISFDKSVYQGQFVGNIDINNFKDIFWVAYVLFCRAIFSPENPDLFFILTAILYCLGYLVFFRRTSNKDYSFYALAFSMLCMGFFAYGNNTSRAGLAISILLLALSLKKINIAYIFLSIISILIHKSLLIPIILYVLCCFVTNTKYYFRFWLFMLVISALNVDISGVFLPVVNFDERVSGYIDGVNNAASMALYPNAGFRLDFITYSLIPIVAGWYYISRLKYADEFYKRIYNTYILANAVWLAVIRIPFSDRFAYLSWFLIPIIMIYPLIDKNKVVENRQRLLFLIVFTFFGYQILKTF